MKLRSVRIINILISLTFCPLAQAGNVVEDVANVGTLGLYHGQKKKREKKLREHIEQQRREIQRRLDEEQNKAKQKKLDTIGTILEEAKIQIKNLISYEDKTFIIFDQLEGIVKRIEHDSNYINEARTISKEAHEAFNIFMKAIEEGPITNQDLEEINEKFAAFLKTSGFPLYFSKESIEQFREYYEANNKGMLTDQRSKEIDKEFNAMLQIFEDENQHLTDLLESALKNMGKIDLLLLESSIQDSINIINTMIESEYNNYDYLSKLFESEAGRPYKYIISIEKRERRYVLNKVLYRPRNICGTIDKLKEEIIKFPF